MNPIASIMNWIENRGQQRIAQEAYEYYKRRASQVAAKYVAGEATREDYLRATATAIAAREGRL